MDETHDIPDWLIERFDKVRKEGIHSHMCLYCGAGVNYNGVGNHEEDCTRPASAAPIMNVYEYVLNCGADPTDRTTWPPLPPWLW